MLKRFIESLLKNPADEQLVALDIGSSSIKLAEINLLSSKPKLQALGAVPVPAGVFSNSVISQTAEVADVLKALLSKVGTKAKKASFCLPGNASFVKKITTNYAPLKEFDELIKFEAANYIPDDLDAVHFDYQILRHNQQKNTMEVLLVAVKNEIVQSFCQAISAAGLEPVVAEVDYFSLSNVFERSYPEVASEKAVAIIDIGARYSQVSILEAGVQLFNGDVAIGAKQYNEVLKDSLGLGFGDAEKAKAGIRVEASGVSEEAIKQALDTASEQLALEIHRQLKFFSGAAELTKDIEEYYLTGGALQVVGLKEICAKKFGKPVHELDPFLNLDCSAVSPELIGSQKYRFGICIGTAYRRLLDKKHATS